MWKNLNTSAISQDDSRDVENLFMSFMAYINPGISMVSFRQEPWRGRSGLQGVFSPSPSKASKRRTLRQKKSIPLCITNHFMTHLMAEGRQNVWGLVCFCKLLIAASSLAGPALSLGWALDVLLGACSSTGLATPLNLFGEKWWLSVQLFYLNFVDKNLLSGCILWHVGLQ